MGAENQLGALGSFFSTQQGESLLEVLILESELFMNAAHAYKIQGNQSEALRLLKRHADLQPKIQKLQDDLRQKT